MSRLFNFRNLIIFIALAVSTLIFGNNIIKYPVKGGFDFTRRTLYARILSTEFRFPTYEETSQVYDAPLFYFTTGLITNAFQKLANFDYVKAVGSIRFISASLGLAAFFLWYKIFLFLYPKKKIGGLFFLVNLISIPVFYRVGSMYVSELYTVFFSTLCLHYFLTKFLKAPNGKNSFVLGLLLSTGLLIRITFLSLILAVVIGITIYYFLNRNLLKAVKSLTIISIVLLLLTGWFYLGRHSGKLTDFGTYADSFEEGRGMPLFKKQRLGFYFDIPLKLMMHYPIRPYLSRPAYFLPIYYSDFWGDYWNYFPQTRFGDEEFQTAKSNRYSYSEVRRTYLAWQSRVNFLPTLLMIISFIFILIKRILALLKREIKVKNVTEFVMAIFVIATWGSFTIVASKFPGEGDWIKAPYALYVAPVYVYFTAVFLFNYLNKYKWIFYPTISILALSMINNLIFSYF